MPGQGVLVGLAKSLEKLSSGFRINRAADDAAGLAISEGLRSQVGGNRQAVRNAQDGISVIQTAEGALNEVHSILQRMRALAVQGANDSNDSKSRNNIKAELTQLRDELERIGKVTNFNGTKLLDGSASGSNAMKFQVGANGNVDNRIVVDFKAADVTKVSRFGGEGYASNVLEATSGKLAKGTGADVNKYAFNIEGKTFEVALGKDDKLSDKLAAAVKNAGAAIVVTTGDEKNAFESKDVTFAAGAVLADKTFTLQIGDNTVKYTDTNGAKGATVTSVVDGLQAELEKKGLTKEYRISTDGKKIKVEALKENAPQVAVKLTTNHTTANDIKVDNVDAKGTLIDTKIGKPTGNGLKFKVDDAAGTIKITRMDGKAIDVDLDHCITKLGTTAGTGDTNIKLTVDKKVDAAVDSNWKKETIDDLDVESHDQAQKLINILDDKINSVSTARSNLGAIQNRFEHTITNLNVAVENLAASESRIRDTDMAQEMMQFTRNQILSQAGTSMLAQANQVPQGVLSLLR